MVGYNELIFEETANPDPVTGEPGAHPVATGIGAAAAGAVATAIGATVGPIGALLGAVVGSIAGGLVGKGAAEAANPTVVQRSKLSSQVSSVTSPPASASPSTSHWASSLDHSYAAYEMAYQVGYEQYARTEQPTSYQEAEPELRREYERRNNGLHLPWEAVHYVVKDAWERAKRNDFFVNEDLYWCEHYYLRPYADPARSYEDYQPAYQIGYESYAEFGYEDRRPYEEVERDLHRRYDAEYASSSLEWEIAQHAVRDAWYRATRTFVNQ
jgi:hypothetical protein